ncbi:MAG: hypothetical protein ABW321_29295 [Polyangiales bacterium]
MISRSISTFVIAITLACLVLPSGHRVTAQAGTPIAVVVALSFQATDISLAQLRRAFKGEPTDYGGARLVPFNYAPESPLRRTFDKSVLDMTAEQAGTYWVDRRIRGQGMSPRVVPAPPIMKAIVAKLPGGIGYVPADQVDGSVRVLTVDGKQLKAADYPVR